VVVLVVQAVSAVLDVLLVLVVPAVIVVHVPAFFKQKLTNLLLGEHHEKPSLASFGASELVSLSWCGPLLLCFCVLWLQMEPYCGWFQRFDGFTLPSCGHGKLAAQYQDFYVWSYRVWTAEKFSWCRITRITYLPRIFGHKVPTCTKKGLIKSMSNC
jgi:hypothetical protein